MIRTQVSLSPEEYDAAKREAQRLGISLAELLRRSLRSMLPVDESRPWMRYAGMVESGDPNSSATVDEVVAALASFSPATLALGKTSFYAIEDMDLDTALDHLHIGLTATGTTADAAEGIVLGVGGVISDVPHINPPKFLALIQKTALFQFEGGLGVLEDPKDNFEVLQEGVHGSSEEGDVVDDHFTPVMFEPGRFCQLIPLCFKHLHHCSEDRCRVQHPHWHFCPSEFLLYTKEG